MDREDALRLLAAPSSHQRLQGARALARVATRRDLAILRKRHREEGVSFVKRALEQIIERLSLGVAYTPPIESSTEDPGADEERVAYSRAVEWVTNSILHEILPRVGMIKVEARRAVSQYDTSSLRRRIDDLNSILQAIEELKRATVSEAIVDVNLYALIEDVVAQETRGRGERVAIQGNKDLMATVDPNLLRMAVSNGIKNALEATTGAKPNSVVIAFGETEVDYWVTILDSGPGFSGPSERAFEIGRTTKSGHRGFGLAIARQAMATMDGNISLQPARSGGARLELRWFR